MKRNEWLAALKDSMLIDAAQAFIARQNDREPKLKENNPLRPVVLWTQRVKLTNQQKDAIARMCGFEGQRGLGWSVISPVWSFEEQFYAVVCQHANGTYAVVYPHGEIDKHTSALLDNGLPRSFIFRSIGDWTMERNAYVPVGRVASTEPLPRAPVERAVDNFQSAPVRISGLYQRGFMCVD